MKLLFRILLLTMALSPVFCRAERPVVTHNFHSDSSDATKLKFKDTNHTGITPLLTYTCTGGAVFGNDLINPSNKKISINLGSSGNTVTTTAVDSLSVVDIYHYPGSACRNIKVKLSRDGVHWSNPLDGEYSAGRIWCRVVPGKYFVQITNTTGTAVSIYEIQYHFGGCSNCFMYIPEE